MACRGTAAGLHSAAMRCPPAPEVRARALLLLAIAGLAAGCAGRAAPQQIAVEHPRPAALTGDLYRPAGAGPFPAVILLHGCSGVGPHTVAWAQWLQAEGYAALVLDSFAGRGLRRLCGDSSPLTGRARGRGRRTDRRDGLLPRRLDGALGLEPGGLVSGRHGEGAGRLLSRLRGLPLLSLLDPDADAPGRQGQLDA